MKFIKTPNMYDVLLKQNNPVWQSVYCSGNDMYLFGDYLIETKLTHPADCFTFL